MQQHPKTRLMEAIQLMGYSVTHQLAADQTTKLWERFMPVYMAHQPQRKLPLFSVQEYAISSFDEFTPQTPFTHWAACLSNALLSLPEDFRTVHIPEGWYWVDTLYGPPSGLSMVMQNAITALTQEGYEVDMSRPHFQRMDHRYKHNEADSEEDLFIPIKKRA